MYKTIDDYSYKRDGGIISHKVQKPTARPSAGYCDWFVAHVDRIAGGVEVSPGIKKHGKASAICVSQRFTATRLAAVVQYSTK